VQQIATLLDKKWPTWNGQCRYNANSGMWSKMLCIPCFRRLLFLFILDLTNDSVKKIFQVKSLILLSGQRIF